MRSDSIIMTKINIKPEKLYISTIIIFIAIILFFTAIYPQTMDELRFSHDNFVDTFKQIKTTLTTDAPRFTVPFHILLLRFPVFWKTLFTILNPFVQLFILFGVFFVVTGRKINFKTKTDFYPFLLLILMYLFLIPCPSNTLIWIGGSLVYSWGFVPPLILLCLFRKTIDGKELKSSVLSNFLMGLCGFSAGMSNENTGPMMLCLTVLFLIYCKYKKIKIPNFYYFALVGIVLGIGAMIGTGAGIARAKKSLFFYEWVKLPMQDKIVLFIGNINQILNATLWLPIINLIGLLLILYDKKKFIIRDKNFILSSLFCLCGFVLIIVLFAAPNILLRTFYSSIVFFFISFIILLLLIREIYHINFIKYLSLFLFIMGIIVSPLIAIPHISIYQQDKLRREYVAQNRKTEKEALFVHRLIIFAAPLDNWSIVYYDILWPCFEKQLKREFGGNISFEFPLDLYLRDAVPANWDKDK